MFIGAVFINGLCLLVLCSSMVHVASIIYTGDGYKNVFLKGGKNITWFAQNRQFEGTPVVQRLVHSRGGTLIDEEGINHHLIHRHSLVYVPCCAVLC